MTSRTPVRAFALASALLAACATLQPAGAQSARDSTIAATQKAASDSIDKLVRPALVQLCDNAHKTAALRVACPVYARFFATIRHGETLLVTPQAAPPPVPIPPQPPPVVTPPVPVPTPTGVSSDTLEPTFSASNVMLYQQNFDSYTLDSLRPACGTSPPRIIDHAVPYCTAGAGWTYDANVTLGPGHSGQAVQWHYDGIYQEVHGAWLPDGAVTPTGKSTIVVQYWAKFTPDTAGQFQRTDANGIPNAMFQIKNVMLWHTANGDNNRFQIMTHMHGACPKYSPSYTTLGVIDMGGTDGDFACTSDQPVGPYLNTFANAQWHRWTIMFKPNTSQGSRDGLARLWIDGQLVIRMDSKACVADVTAEVSQPIAGGWKAWCDLAELDALYSGVNGISGIEWGANRTDGPEPGVNVGMPFTMAIDDVKWWRQ